MCKRMKCDIFVCCDEQVTSKKDQEQYWANKSEAYRFVTVSEFGRKFKQFDIGIKLQNDLSSPYDKSLGHKAALVYHRYSISKLKLLKACTDKEWLLIKRNSFIHIFKLVQLIFIGFVSSTVFFRTEMHHRNEDDGAIYIGALIFAMIVNMFNGYADLALTIFRLPVFFKQRDLLFHPAWTFTLPTILLRIPLSLLESAVWMVMTYYTVGFAPQPSRYDPLRISYHETIHISILLKLKLFLDIPIHSYTSIFC